MADIRGFLKKKDGSATLEIVIWLPVLMLLAAVIFDGALLYTGRTELWSVASNASRQVALGQMTVAEAKTYVEAIDGGGYNATITSDGTTVTTNVTLPFRNIRGIGVLTSNSAVLSATSHYRIEPTI